MATGLPVPDTDPALPAAVLRELQPAETYLTSYPVAVVLTVLGAGAVAWAVVRARRGARARRARRARGEDPRRPWRSRVATASLAALGALSLVLGLAVGANTYSGYVPTWGAARVQLVALGLADLSADAPGGAHRGQVRTLAIPGTAAEKIADEDAWVYLPPGFDPEGSTRYPVVYLIHGSPDDPSSWFAAGRVPRTMDVLIRRGLVDPMIVVAPTVNGTGPGGLDTECLDSTTGGEQVETYLTTTVVDTVDATYPTVADREHRVLGGMSSGGFCALNVGLRNLDLYGAILAIEPYGNPGPGPERTMLSTQAEIDANTPTTYLPTMTFTHPMPVFLDSGQDAPREALTTVRRMAQDLEDQGQTVELREEPGQAHTWAMAATALPYGLVFAQRQMAGGG
ncbi:alpha/beta hydrolase [Cellulosimicrobium funkei]